MGVQRVLSKFRKIPEMEQSKKMVNQESFLSQRIAKATEQLKKQCKDNREKEMTQVMFQNLIGKVGIHGLNMMDLNDLGWLIDQNLKEIDKMVDLINKTSQNLQGSSSSSVAATPSVMTTVMPEATPRTSVRENVQMETNNNNNKNVDSMQRQHWIMEFMNNNPQNHVGFGGDEMMFPFVDNINLNNNDALWSNAFFQWEK
ncbi:hypothetical protein V6N11_057003 [Hibiscus sabdariffa]|uniref:Agamous-like MADS-box protein AGL80 n=2 Tax=Hibiscus sabdariffa TaxID=183260 RepID=A0ABR2AQM4_9ROSI